jgi:hypothetical protein
MSDSNDLIKAANNISGLLKDKMNKSQQNINEQIHLVRTNRKYQKAFLQRFVKMESWLLLSEAIPICLGYGPEYEAYAKGDKDYSKIENLAKGLEASNLDIIDHHKPIKEWKVKPKDFVKWLSDYDQYVIDELCVYFLNGDNSNSSAQYSAVSDAQSERHALVRESIYKAVIYILAHYSDQCRDPKGKVVATKVESLLQMKADYWFVDKEVEGDGVPLSGEKILKIIREAVKEITVLKKDRR